MGHSIPFSLGAGASLEFRIGALDLETGGFADFLLDNVELEMTAHPDFTWGLVPPLPAPPVLPPPGSISLPEDWLADPVPVGGVVPEPTSALMLGLGSCLVFQRRSRAEKK